MSYKFLLFTVISCYTVCGTVLADCSQLGESGHGCAAGTYWSNGSCNNTCPAGYYCPSGGIAYCCPEPFGYSDTQTSTIGQCEAHIQCGSNPNDIAIITCNENNWENNKCTPGNAGPQMYTVQWTYDTTINPHNIQKTAYGWLTSDNSPMEIWSVPDGYHLETKPIYGPNSNYSEWTETSFEIMCVPNTKTCKSFNAPDTFSPIDCGSYSSTNCPNDQGCGLINVGQGTGTLPVYQCTYLNNIGASIEQTHCSAENINNENAYWVDQYDANNQLSFGYWDVSACECNFTNKLDSLTAHCYGSGTYISSFNTNSTPPAISIVHTINEHIIFDPYANSSNFVCTKCQEGPYYVDGNDNLVTVTKCEKAETYGTWRKPDPNHPGYCNNDTNTGSSWTYPLTGNPCKLQNCAAGKTTATLAPIGSDSCQYSPQTEFCDAKGCFQINAGDFSNWNF